MDEMGQNTYHCSQCFQGSVDRTCLATKRAALIDPSGGHWRYCLLAKAFHPVSEFTGPGAPGKCERCKTRAKALREAAKRRKADSTGGTADGDWLLGADDPSRERNVDALEQAQSRRQKLPALDPSSGANSLPLGSARRVPGDALPAWDLSGIVEEQEKAQHLPSLQAPLATGGGVLGKRGNFDDAEAMALDITLDVTQNDAIAGADAQTFNQTVQFDQHSTGVSDSSSSSDMDSSDWDGINMRELGEVCVGVETAFSVQSCTGSLDSIACMEEVLVEVKSKLQLKSLDSEPELCVVMATDGYDPKAIQEVGHRRHVLWSMEY